MSKCHSLNMLQGGLFRWMDNGFQMSNAFKWADPPYG